MLVVSCARDIQVAETACPEPLPAWSELSEHLSENAQQKISKSYLSWEPFPECHEIPITWCDTYPTISDEHLQELIEETKTAPVDREWQEEIARD